jgi:hypothetical protein
MNAAVKWSREFANPTGETFSCPPIGGFVRKYLSSSKVSVDPFSRNKRWATHTNDINPVTAAEHHMDAEEFLKKLAADGLAGRVDLAILDPPYSPRQITECYKEFGRVASMTDTQNAVLYSRVKAALLPLLTRNAVVLCFGWNSAGMGPGFERVEIMLVSHGAAHNDTICIAERRLDHQGMLI